MMIHSLVVIEVAVVAAAVEVVMVALVDTENTMAEVGNKVSVMVVVGGDDVDDVVDDNLKRFSRVLYE